MTAIISFAIALAVLIYGKLSYKLGRRRGVRDALAYVENELEESRKKLSIKRFAENYAFKKSKKK